MELKVKANQSMINNITMGEGTDQILNWVGCGIVTCSTITNLVLLGHLILHRTTNLVLVLLGEIAVAALALGTMTALDLGGIGTTGAGPLACRFYFYLTDVLWTTIGMDMFWLTRERLRQLKCVQVKLPPWLTWGVGLIFSFFEIWNAGYNKKTNECFRAPMGVNKIIPFGYELLKFVVIYFLPSLSVLVRSAKVRLTLTFQQAGDGGDPLLLTHVTEIEAWRYFRRSSFCYVSLWMPMWILTFWEDRMGAIFGKEDYFFYVTGVRRALGHILLIILPMALYATDRKFKALREFEREMEGEELPEIPTPPPPPRISTYRRTQLQSYGHPDIPRRSRSCPNFQRDVCTQCNLNWNFDETAF